MRPVERLVETAQLSPSSRGDRDGVAPWVVCIGRAECEARFFKVVDRTDDLLAIDPKPASELGLAERTEFLERSQIGVAGATARTPVLSTTSR